MPNFDSPSVFARILDKDKGGHFSITPLLPFTTKQNYLPSSNVGFSPALLGSGVVEECVITLQHTLDVPLRVTDIMLGGYACRFHFSTRPALLGCSGFLDLITCGFITSDSCASYDASLMFHHNLVDNEPGCRSCKRSI